MKSDRGQNLDTQCHVRASFVSRDFDSARLGLALGMRLESRRFYEV